MSTTKSEMRKANPRALSLLEAMFSFERKEGHCQYCLAKHDEGESCQCFKCGTKMHPSFIICAFVDDERVALCPDCAPL